MIHHLDHLVLTTSHQTECIHFYCVVLGMRLETFTGGTPLVQRQAFKFGNQKINLHIAGAEFEPKAHLPTPGSLDLCFMLTVPLAEAIRQLRMHSWPIEQGPVIRTGASAKIRSIYVRDPDLNLIELSELISPINPDAR
jgi:catechol 2,3-dioxygenase-like lactoylglutathione lyase family enzyme